MRANRLPYRAVPYLSLAKTYKVFNKNWNMQANFQYLHFPTYTCSVQCWRSVQLSDFGLSGAKSLSSPTLAQHLLHPRLHPSCSLMYYHPLPPHPQPPPILVPLSARCQRSRKGANLLGCADFRLFGRPFQCSAWWTKKSPAPQRVPLMTQGLAFVSLRDTLFYPEQDNAYCPGTIYG